MSRNDLIERDSIEATKAMECFKPCVQLRTANLLCDSAGIELRTSSMRTFGSLNGGSICATDEPDLGDCHIGIGMPRMLLAELVENVVGKVPMPGQKDCRKPRRQ